MMPALTLIDSHTAGEPTRTVVSAIPQLQGLSCFERRERLQAELDWIRTALIFEPRGSNVMIGAVLGESILDDCVASVVFFNNVGYLGMCGHGLIGIVTTLAHQGKIKPGFCKIDTPVGVVSAELLPDGRVRFQNVPAYRYRTDVQIDVPGHGIVTGDVAWGGNWFFLSQDISEPICWNQTPRLTQYANEVRRAAESQGVTGAEGALIDHYEFFRPAVDDGADVDNFVLCPGGAFDRSPCGTGTSAKLACLAANGKLAAGQPWRQRSVTGGVFEGTYQWLDDQQIIPTVTGRAHVNGVTEILIDPSDPLRFGFGGSSD